jgi:hypothetical protein
MKKAFLILMIFSFNAFASDVKPASASEMAKLTQFGLAPKLGACMVVYKFDFFSDQFGFSIDGGKVSEADKLVQFRLFLNTGKLELRDRREKVDKDLSKHCAIVAQTAVEILAMKLGGHVEDDEAPAQSSQEN